MAPVEHFPGDGVFLGGLPKGGERLLPTLVCASRAEAHLLGDNVAGFALVSPSRTNVRNGSFGALLEFRQSPPFRFAGQGRLELRANRGSLGVRQVAAIDVEGYGQNVPTVRG